jgi:hypothetical protein
MSYLHIRKKETLKAHVFADHFDKAEFAYDTNAGNIGFIVTSVFLGTIAFCLWAEAKKGVVDAISMLTQLILTCKKTYDSSEYPPPPFIGCFDAVKIGFVPFHDILPIFADNDVNWNAAPSNYRSADFLKIRKKVEKLTAENMTTFNFDEASAEIKDFIKKNFVTAAAAAKSPITKNNFPHIYNRWVKEVKPSINISAEHWQKYKREGVSDGDFFIADMMSKDGSSITERILIAFENNTYKLKKEIEGDLFKLNIDFTDGGGAYNRFWNKYERPPAEEYQQYIIGRSDLLAPPNIREVKGSFYTPAIWVEKAQAYLEKAFGENWQDEYCIWDCAAGTGNLLAGLQNPYNLWASDIDQPNVDAIRALIGGGLNLLHDHVFQFDFLNDSFDKLPEGLRNIIEDKEKRKKLIIYINPPYAEVSSLGVTGKPGVNQSKTHDKYAQILGTAGRELFAQFLVRIYFEMPGCKIGEFSKMKLISGSAFNTMRKYFLANLEKCFVVPSRTFDNVKGSFPIGFKIWNAEIKEPITEITADIYDEKGMYTGDKKFVNYGKEGISRWIGEHRIALRKLDTAKNIGFLSGTNGGNFQTNNIVFIVNAREQTANPRGLEIQQENLIPACVYYSVRHVVPATWLNDRDQFLYPNDGWETDTEFQHNGLVYTLFNTNISCKYGVNHWIPFTEKEAGAREKFESNFMSSFLTGKTFSEEAQAVLSAGKALWKYFHKNSNAISVNASFYDIREYFQGRKETGKMNVKSADETYNALIKALRDALKILAKKIEPKVYEYGFLKE